MSCCANPRHLCLAAFSALVIGLIGFCAGSLQTPKADMIHAGDGSGLNLPPQGSTVINFSATEKKTLTQDLLIASLRIEAEDSKDPAIIQKKINESMAKALELAKTAGSDLKISTGNYTVYKNDNIVFVHPETGEEKRDIKWVGSQTIEFRSHKPDILLDIAGKVQGLGFLMNDLSYSVSPELLEKTRDELLTAALEKLVSKADIVAKTLGKSKVDLADVNVDTGSPVTPMYKNMMARAEVAMAADAAMPTPVAQAGETEVQLTVSARALVR